YDALKVHALGFQHMAELLFNLKPPSRWVAGGESDKITARIEAIKAWVQILFCRSDATQVGTVRERATDGIGEIGANKRGGDGAGGVVRGVTRKIKLLCWPAASDGAAQP